MAGTIFLERYQINDVLGQGGMGVVYRAHDTLLGREVAIKKLSKSNLSPEGQARLLREAQSAAQLNHPNIVAVYDAGARDGYPFIIMELVEGPSLHEKPPADLDSVLHIATQICAALEHAHTRGIIHRDLKPENVLVTPEGTVKLMDFGLARSVASRLTGRGTIEGSVFYLAPELALAQEYDGRADLYALGVMLYEFTTGELPFTASDPLAVISQHLHATAVPPRVHNPALPPMLDALILRLLSKKPADRPSSAREVIHLLERIECGEEDEEFCLEPSELDAIARGRMIGRKRELQEATEAWNRARAGKSRALLISGEPGIGKTRLARELMAQAQIQSAHVLTGDCYAEVSTPFAPVSQILEEAARLHPLADFPGLPGLLSLAPGLRARFPQVPPVKGQGASSEQQWMFETFVDLIARLSGQAPVLLVLEDAHWADSGTLSLLRHLVRRASRLNLRLLVLLTYREMELDETRLLSQVLYDFSRERLGERIKLGRLDRSATRELLEALLRAEVAPELFEHIYSETEGNPFFIEEVCKALVEGGTLYRENSHWKLAPSGELEIPQSIRIAIQARVSRLPAAVQDTLRLASIFGRDFQFGTLKEISDLDEDSLIEALEVAVRAQLITETPPEGRPRSVNGSTFAFAHSLTASTLSESMSGLRRQRLHERAGLALERLYPGKEAELAPELGRHFNAAGMWDKAAHYLLLAGDEARAVFAYVEAIQFYEQALEILKDLPDTERASRTLMKLGLLYHATFDFRRSRQAYQEGFILWQQVGEKQGGKLPPSPRPLRLSLDNPMTLDPSTAFEGGSIQMIRQLFSGLVSLTPDLDIAPEVAQSWEVQENGRKYRFNLRRDFRWTDGVPVTAGDFEFAWKRTLIPETRSRNPVLLYDIRNARAFHEGRITDPAEIGVRALDDYTLEVELEQPIGYFLQLLSCSATFPVPRHVVQKHGDDWSKPENLVTNGPFILETWQPRKQLILVRSPHYPGTFKGNVQRVEISLRAAKTQFEERLAAYEADRLDAVTLSHSSPASVQVRQQHAGEYIAGPLAHTSFLVFDVTRPPFDDVRVRRAFVHAIDREALAAVHSRGFFDPAVTGLVPVGLPGHSGLPGLPYDPARARQLLTEAGYPDPERFPTVIIWLSKDLNLEWYRIIENQWRENLGVKSEWIWMEKDDFYDRLLNEQPHVVLNGWLADYLDPDNFLRVCISYQSNWNHPQYRELVENARRVTSHTERTTMYRRAEEILFAEVPLMPLVYGRTHMLIKPHIRRFPISPVLSLFLKDVKIDPQVE